MSLVDGSWRCRRASVSARVSTRVAGRAVGAVVAVFAAKQKLSPARRVSHPPPLVAAHSATSGAAAGDRPQRTSNSGSCNKKIVTGDSDVRLNMLPFF